MFSATWARFASRSSGWPSVNAPSETRPSEIETTTSGHDLQPASSTYVSLTHAGRARA
jgi:hypothetical protein